MSYVPSWKRSAKRGPRGELPLQLVAEPVFLPPFLLCFSSSRAKTGKIFQLPVVPKSPRTWREKSETRRRAARSRSVDEKECLEASTHERLLHLRLTGGYFPDFYFISLSLTAFSDLSVMFDIKKWAKQQVFRSGFFIVRHRWFSDIFPSSRQLRNDHARNGRKSGR